MTQPKKMSKRKKLCCLLALILLLAIVAMNARANTGTPSPCVKAAIAAKQARTLPETAASNVWELQFIKLSKYLWVQAAGNEARVLKWYREGCEQRMAPDYFRVSDGKIHTERRL